MQPVKPYIAIDIQEPEKNSVFCTPNFKNRGILLGIGIGCSLAGCLAQEILGDTVGGRTALYTGGSCLIVVFGPAICHKKLEATASTVKHAAFGLLCSASSGLVNGLLQDSPVGYVVQGLGLVIGTSIANSHQVIARCTPAPVQPS